MEMAAKTDTSTVNLSQNDDKMLKEFIHKVSKKSDNLEIKTDEDIIESDFIVSFGNSSEKETEKPKSRIRQAQLMKMMNILKSHREPNQKIIFNKENLKTSKRFLGFIIFFILTTVIAYSIASTVAESTVRISKEKIITQAQIAYERLQLENLEIRELKKNSERLDVLEKRVDIIDKQANINHTIYKNDMRHLKRRQKL